MAVASLPALPGWLAYPAWLLAGLGAGLTMSSVSVLLLNYTNDADRGADSAALQLSDATASALTTGVAGVLVAAAARGAISSTAGFVTLDLLMCCVALIGVATARRARPADVLVQRAVGAAR
jgi:sugar phosphate permease